MRPEPLSSTELGRHPASFHVLDVYRKFHLYPLSCPLNSDLVFHNQGVFASTIIEGTVKL